MMRLTRPNPSCPGWRSPRCRAAAGRASAQSSLCAARGAPVVMSLSGQLVTAVRAPCVRDARHLQCEVESTRRFHVVQRLATFAPFRSCTFTTRLASGAAPTPGQRGQDKRGRHRSAGKHREIKAAPRRGTLHRVPLSLEKPQNSKIAAAPCD